MIFEELFALVGVKVDKKAKKNIDNFVRGAVNSIKNISLALFGAFSGIGILIAKEIAEVSNVAIALDVDAKTLENIGNAVKPIGFNFENVADIIEEMTNKINEFEESAPVKEAFGQLGLQFEEIKKLNPQKQFEAIGDAALKMQDQATARSAVDTLMGGEANKIFGFLGKTGKSIQQIISDQDKLNFQTDASRKGGVALAGAWASLTRTFETASKFIVGTLGPDLANIINKVREFIGGIVNLVRSNPDGIMQRITSALRVLATIAGVAAAAWVALGLKALVAQVRMLLLPIAIGLVVGALALLIEDFITFIRTGGEADTLTGRLIEKFPILAGVVQFVADVFRNAYEILLLLGPALAELFGNFEDGRAALSTELSDWLENIFLQVDKILNLWTTLQGAFGAISGKVGGVLESLGITSPSQPTVNPNIAAAGRNVANQGTNNTTNNANRAKVEINVQNGDVEEIKSAVTQVINENNAVSISDNDTGVVF